MASKQAVRMLTRIPSSVVSRLGVWAHPNHGSVEATLACEICGRTLAEQTSRLDWYRKNPEVWERRVREIEARDERRLNGSGEGR